MKKQASSQKSKPAYDQCIDINRVIQLGIDSYQSGEMDTAQTLFDHVLSLSPENPDALHYMGLLAFHHDQKNAAISIILQALTQAPQRFDIHYNLGQIYDSMDNRTAAISCYETALKLNPDAVDIINRLGHVYTRSQNYQQAIHLYTDALRRFPDDVTLITRTGMLLYELQMPHSALPFFRKSLQLQSSNTVSRLYLSECLKSTGELESAKAYAQSVLSIDPENINAYCSLSETEKFSPGHPAFSFLEKQADNGSLTNQARAGILFSLGKMYADTGEYDRSFDCYRRANELRKTYTGLFDRDLFTRRLDIWESIFTGKYFEGHKEHGLASEIPVFIVGMPRSGTSLVEQILASHSKVYGAGELKQISHLAATLCDVERDFESARHISRSAVYKAAETYLSYIQTLAPSASRIVDKMPGNQFYLWAIALMFPRARIVYCKRDPVDTCVACFIKNFTERHLYANDLADLGYYYARSASMMNHWAKTLPNPILEVNYESVIADIRGTIQRLLDFCGLEWEDACMEFHKTERKVLTASRTQVRKKLYSSSIGRHKRYERHLEPLMIQLRKSSR